MNFVRILFVSIDQLCYEGIVFRKFRCSCMSLSTMFCSFINSVYISSSENWFLELDVPFSLPADLQLSVFIDGILV